MTAKIIDIEDARDRLGAEHLDLLDLLHSEVRATAGIICTLESLTRRRELHFDFDGAGLTELLYQHYERLDKIRELALRCYERHRMPH
jgi:hypothetical protein